MTITTFESLRNYYVGDDIQQDWPITFPFLSKEDVHAILVNTEGDESQLLQGDDFTVTKNADHSGGSLHCLVPAGFELVIYLNQRLYQGLDLRNNGLLDAESLEHSLDKLTLILAQLQDRMSSCLKISIADKRSLDEVWQGFDEAVKQTLALAAQVTADKQFIADCLNQVLNAVHRFVNSEEIGTAMLQAMNGSYAGYTKNLGCIIDGYIERLRLEYATLSPLGKAGASAEEVRIEANAQLARIETEGQQYLEMVRIEGEAITIAKQEACRWADMSLDSLEQSKAITAELPNHVQAGIDTLKREYEALQQQILSDGQSLFPQGIICLWSGVVTSIPHGWLLCNGLNGTPNLTDKFVVGSGGAYEVNSQGGATTHGHGVTVSGTTLTTSHIPWHSHGVELLVDGKTLPGNTSFLLYGGNGTALVKMRSTSTGGVGGSQAHGHSAVTAAASSLPPFYALAYIMKG